MAEAKKGDFKKPYAISAPEKGPPDWPTNSNRKKRAVASSTQINVGTDSSCKDGDTTLCNGPLKSNQQYCDSDCIVGAKTKLNPTPIIVGVTVAVALVVILAGAIYVLRQRRIGFVNNFNKIIVGVVVTVALLAVLALLVDIFRRQQQTK
ncbi:hypothetical protein EB796_011153 [Bugula neritina]|uniref:Uncharacterized protein n=1 Tax=Bugula neritina TaxID=10212 RepID=A0A7J7JXS3_BUGNE|nr:hypothetical protein EB796_011153 [Bugula neritina]